MQQHSNALPKFVNVFEATGCVGPLSNVALLRIGEAESVLTKSVIRHCVRFGVKSPD